MPQRKGVCEGESNDETTQLASLKGGTNGKDGSEPPETGDVHRCGADGQQAVPGGIGRGEWMAQQHGGPPKKLPRRRRLEAEEVESKPKGKPNQTPGAIGADLRQIGVSTCNGVGLKAFQKRRS